MYNQLPLACASGSSLCFGPPTTPVAIAWPECEESQSLPFTPRESMFDTSLNVASLVDSLPNAPTCTCRARAAFSRTRYAAFAPNSSKLR